MKHLFLLLLILPTGCFSLDAQSSKEPFKKANTILIETGLDSEDAFRNWGRHLVQNGYYIDTSDDTFLSLTTGPKDTSEGETHAFFLISTVTDAGTIILTMKWQVKGSAFYEWEYKPPRDREGSLFKNILKVMYKDVLPTIQSFGPTNISYELR